MSKSTLPLSTALLKFFVGMPAIVAADSAEGLLFAYVLQRLWTWHLQSIAQPWPVTRIYAVMLVANLVQIYWKSYEDASKKEDAFIEAFATLIIKAIAALSVLLVGWWLT